MPNMACRPTSKYPREVRRRLPLRTHPCPNCMKRHSMVSDCQRPISHEAASSCLDQLPWTQQWLPRVNLRLEPRSYLNVVGVGKGCTARCREAAISFALVVMAQATNCLTLSWQRMSLSPWPEAPKPDHSNTCMHRSSRAQSRLLVNCRHSSVESEALVDERL
jgi:hypothetical protein